MSNAKHTRGPWKATGPMADGQDIVGIEIGAETVAGHMSVAWVLLGKKPTPMELRDGQADARLIAAAPALLAGLKKALLESGCDGDLCTHEWHDVARSLIAAVEGRDG